MLLVLRTVLAVGPVRAQATSRTRRSLSSSDQAAETDAQLLSLHEVSAAADLAALGRRSEAASLLERAVEICSGSMGQDSALARAAVQRWGGLVRVRVISFLANPNTPQQSTVDVFHRIKARARKVSVRFG